MYKFIVPQRKTSTTYKPGMIPVYHSSEGDVGSAHWITASEIIVINRVNKFKINIPEGFLYDLASVPWTFSRILPKAHPRMFKAALVHDYLYWTRTGTKEEADNIFYEIMIQEGMVGWKAKAAYKAVDLFGRSAWEDDD